MLPKDKFGRRLLGACLVLVASCLSVLAAKGFRRPYVAESPEYRKRGDPASRVAIIEFSDFQCPACAGGLGVLRNLENLYGKNLRVVFKHFPLERHHPRARLAAQAAECAGRQGRFWPMHDLLFDNQAQWTESPDPQWIMGFARGAGLDLTAFSACLKDPGTDASINSDIKEGGDHWVASTPTFFVNGKRFVGGRQLSVRAPPFIEKELKR